MNTLSRQEYKVMQARVALEEEIAKLYIMQYGSAPEDFNHIDGVTRFTQAFNADASNIMAYIKNLSKKVYEKIYY